MRSARAWTKMLIGGSILIFGGPALVEYVRPTEEELFKRFNPEIQKRNLENRERRQQEFDHFVTQLKEHAKSDRNIWEAIKSAEQEQKEQQKQQKQREQWKKQEQQEMQEQTAEK